MRVDARLSYMCIHKSIHAHEEAPRNQAVAHTHRDIKLFAKILLQTIEYKLRVKSISRI